MDSERLAIKLFYNGILRRISFAKTDFSISQLISGTVRIFPGLDNELIQFLYTDEDNDDITFSSDLELQDILQSSNRLLCLKFTVVHLQRNNTPFRSIPPAKNSLNDFELNFNSILNDVEKLLEHNRSSILIHDYAALRDIMVQVSRRKFNSKAVDNCTEASQNLSIHADVKCDGCSVVPLVGVRFKCSIRDNYDLCEDCEAKSDHSIPFLKIYDPRQCPRALVTLLKEDEKPASVTTQNESQLEPRAADAGKWHKRNSSSCNLPNNKGPNRVTKPVDGDNWRRAQSQMEPCSSAVADSVITNGRKSYCSPAVESTFSAPLISRLPKPMARFVRDVSLPDGSSVIPGAPTVKTWLLRNDGEASWPVGVCLIHVSGDVISDDVRVPVRSAAVDEEVAVSVALHLPIGCRPGRYISYWRLQAPVQASDASTSGRATSANGLFGHRVWADIRVVEEAEKGPLRPIEISRHEQDLDDNSTATSDTELMFSRLGSSLISNRSEVDSSHSESSARCSVETVGHFDPLCLTGQWVEVGKVEGVSSSGMDMRVRKGVLGSARMCESIYDESVVQSEYVEGEDLWTRELRILAEMGFTDKTKLVPILAAHFEEPSDASRAAPVNPDCLARCLSALLTM